MKMNCDEKCWEIFENFTDVDFWPEAFKYGCEISGMFEV